MIAGLLEIADKIQADEMLSWDDRVLLAALSHIAHQQLARKVEDSKERREARAIKNSAKAEARLTKVKSLRIYEEQRDTLQAEANNNEEPPF